MCCRLQMQEWVYVLQAKPLFVKNESLFSWRQISFSVCSFFELKKDKKILIFYYGLNVPASCVLGMTGCLLFFIVTTRTLWRSLGNKLRVWNNNRLYSASSAKPHHDTGGASSVIMQSGSEKRNCLLISLQQHSFLRSLLCLCFSKLMSFLCSMDSHQKYLTITKRGVWAIDLVLLFWISLYPSLP